MNVCDIRVYRGCDFWMGIHAVDSVSWKHSWLQSCVWPYKLIFSILSVQVQLWGLPGHSWLASVPDCSASSGGHRVRFGFGWTGWRIERPGGLQLQGHPQLPPKYRWGFPYNLGYCVLYLLRSLHLLLLSLLTLASLSLLQCTVMQAGWCLALLRIEHVSACRDGFISMRVIPSKRYERTPYNTRTLARQSPKHVNNIQIQMVSVLIQAWGFKNLTSMYKYHWNCKLHWLKRLWPNDPS